MRIRRRELMLAGAAAIMGARGASPAIDRDGGEMYGLIGKMIAVPGKRDELIAILLEGVAAMPGCLSYIVAKDPGNDDAIWITEAWDSQDSHQASLSQPSVKAAIAKGRPLIASFSDHVVTIPVGGHGLVSSTRVR
jgi:quinol monooxygenase YgiN